MMKFNISPQAKTIVDAIDVSAQNFFTQIHGPILTNVVEVITHIFDPRVLVIVSAVIAGTHLYKKELFIAYRLLLSMVSASVFVVLIKWIIARPRPIYAMFEESGFSMPSGHATIGTVFFLLIYLTYRTKISGKNLSRIFFLSAILLSFIVGISRVYLGVHYATDVIGGFILGSIIVAIATLPKSYRGAIQD